MVYVYSICSSFFSPFFCFMNVICWSSVCCWSLWIVFFFFFTFIGHQYIESNTHIISYSNMRILSMSHMCIEFVVIKREKHSHKPQIHTQCTAPIRWWNREDNLLMKNAQTEFIYFIYPSSSMFKIK